MTDPVRTTPDDDAVDASLREALEDDLPDGVERRLERSFDLALERRRRAAGLEGPLRRLLAGLVELVPRGPVLTRLAVPAALVLVMSGAFLQAEGSGAGGAGPVSRVNAVATVSNAIRLAGPLLCAVEPGGAALSPEALSRRVYRSWALVESGRAGGAGTRLVFRALDDASLYELEVEPGSCRPRRLRRLGGAGSPRGAGVPEECEWPAPPERAGAPAEGRSR